MWSLEKGCHDLKIPPGPLGSAGTKSDLYWLQLALFIDVICIESIRSWNFFLVGISQICAQKLSHTIYLNEIIELCEKLDITSHQADKNQA